MPPLLLIGLACAAPDPPTAPAAPSDPTAELLGWLDAASGLEPLRSAALTLLDDLRRATPQGVVVTSVAFSGPDVRITARTPDAAGREAFVAGLCAQLLTGCASEGTEALLLTGRQGLPEPPSALGATLRAASADERELLAARHLPDLLRARMTAIPTTHDPTALTELALTLGRKSGVEIHDVEAQPEADCGGVRCLTIRLSGVAGYHNLAILSDRLSRAGPTSYWAELSMVPAVAPADWPAAGLARAQAAHRAGWPSDAQALAFSGALVWTAGDGAPPTSRAIDAWPRRAGRYEVPYYNPREANDPFSVAAPSPPEPEPLAPGAWVVREVPLADALRLFASAEGRELRAHAVPARAVTLGGLGGTEAALARAIEDTELVVRRRPGQLIVAPRGSDLPDAAPTTDGPPALQAADIHDFWLVGVADGRRPSALLADADGGNHVATTGSYVGRNWGKVTAILGDAIVVTEEYQTLDGELVLNPVRRRLIPSQVTDEP